MSVFRSVNPASQECLFEAKGWSQTETIDVLDRQQTVWPALAALPPKTRSVIEFVDVDGKTELTLRAEYPSAADLKTVLDMGMAAGITETLDRLDEHLADLVGLESRNAKR